MAQASCFSGDPAAFRRCERRPPAGALAGFGRWLAEWREVRRQVRSEAAMRRSGVYYDDHLLRDIGLVRTGSRLVPVDPNWNPLR